MFERVTVDLDDQMLPSASYLQVCGNGGELQVTISPRVEARTLAALRRDLAESIANAMDARQQPSPP